MSIFFNSSDTAIERWESGGKEWAIGVDPEPSCPAGDFYSCRNAARRKGDSWSGDQSVLSDPNVVIAEYEYNGSRFEGAATSRQEAENIAKLYAQWAEGDVYAIERGSESVGGHFTSDGLPPSRAEAEAAF
ncbi:hypothetical protein [Gordonia malaquae]|uniref:hypothetical protein n=1 Tax=Gordonia malaquae TaxID=410332 RepID=UPI0030164706